MSGGNLSKLFDSMFVEDVGKSNVSKWYVDSMLASDVANLLRLKEAGDTKSLEFREILTRVTEVFDRKKLLNAYDLIGMMLSSEEAETLVTSETSETSSVVNAGVVEVGDDLVVRGNIGYTRSKGSERDEVVDKMRNSVNELLSIPYLAGSRTVLDDSNKDVLDMLNNRLNNVIESSDDTKVGDRVDADVAEDSESLTDKERELIADGYVRTVVRDDVGNDHLMYSKSFDRVVIGYVGMKEVCKVLGKSEPYVRRIGRMIGAVMIRNRMYADELLVERVRSELVSIKKVGSGYMSVTDFALAANMTRRSAMRVMRTRLDYKERNTNVFVKRSAANKFIRENVESVPNPFEYVTVREIEYATGIMITSEYTDSDSISSGLSLKYRNNRMILMSELLRILDVRGKLDTFNVKVRNDLLLDYMNSYIELNDTESKREFRKSAGVYGRYLHNMDDLEDPERWLKDMVANDEYMSFANVLEASVK